MRGRDPNRIDALLNLVHRCRELGATPMANGAVLEEEDGPEDCEGYYWRHVGETIGRPYMLLSDFLELEHGGPGRTIEILSLGSGSCNQAFNLARTLDSEYRIRCINDDKAAVDAARRRAETEGLDVELEEADLNTIKIDPGRYHLILAHAILWNVIELEHLLEQIFNGLHASGFLQVVDIVGKDRVLLWEENEQLVNSLLADLPDAVTSGQRVEVGLSEGPHGLRLEETLGLLEHHFEGDFVHLHGGFMRFLWTDPALARCFDPRDPVRRSFLDVVIAVDDAAVELGIVRPLELWGIFKPRSKRSVPARIVGARRDMQIERLIVDNPAFHDSCGGTSENWSTPPAVLRFLHERIRPGMRTLETGAGQTTVAIALAGARHVCVTPSRREAERIEAYLASVGLAGAVTFLVGSSDGILPQSGVIPGSLDLVFIDGAHRFPFPILDWHFAEARLRVGGLLGIDDTWIPSVRCLLDFLRGEVEWSVEQELENTVFVQKRREAGRGRDWMDQLYNSPSRCATEKERKAVAQFWNDAG